MKNYILCGAASVLLSLNSCTIVKDSLRGESTPSDDGLTYLVFEEGNGCDAIIIDGVKWKHDVAEKGRITPGKHAIECNGNIEFEIEKGTTFHFDYWGP